MLNLELTRDFLVLIIVLIVKEESLASLNVSLTKHTQASNKEATWV